MPMLPSQVWSNLSSKNTEHAFDPHDDQLEELSSTT